MLVSVLKKMQHYCSRMCLAQDFSGANYKYPQQFMWENDNELLLQFLHNVSHIEMHHKRTKNYHACIECTVFILMYIHECTLLHSSHIPSMYIATCLLRARGYSYLQKWHHCPWMGQLGQLTYTWSQAVFLINSIMICWVTGARSYKHQIAG